VTHKFKVTSTALIVFLFGVLLLSIVLFKGEWLWALGNVGVWLNALLTGAGIILTLSAVGQMTSIPPKYTLGGLFLAEITLITIGFVIAKNQLSEAPALNFIKNVYSMSLSSLQYNDALNQYDPRLGYLYKKNSTGSFSQWEFPPQTVQTNALGLRDDSLSGTHPDIIALGDSYTTGWGVNQHESFPELVEKQLHRQVLNAGIASFGTVRESVLLQQLPLDSCKLLIIQYCINDITENKTWADSLRKGYTYAPSFDQHEYTLRQTYNTISGMYFPFKYVLNTTKKALQFLFLPRLKHDPFFKYTAQPIDEHILYFYKTLEYLQQHYKGSIVVISLSDSPSFDREFIQKAQEKSEAFHRHSLYFLNVTDSLTKEDFYLIDGHATAKGHSKIAQNLAQFIKNKHL
jgi:lysophospholipase L1-like esterase